MSQTALTDFFSVRKKIPDQHAAKRRKIIQEDAGKNELAAEVKSVVTSATDEHSTQPKTPSTSDKDATNSRTSKRSSENTKESGKTPEEKGVAAPRFTQGAPPTSAKKKLDMSKDSTNTKRNVSFTKLAPMSPKKNVVSILGERENSEESKTFKVPTPVKVLIGARRGKSARNIAAKNLFQDDGDESVKASRPRRTGAAQLESTVTRVKKMTQEDVKDKLGKVKNMAELKAALKNLKKDTSKLEQAKKKKEPLLTPTKSGPPMSGLIVEVPVSPRKGRVPPLGDVKVSPRKVPAYQRFSHLTRPVEKTLVLPYNYKLLAEVFTNTDMAISMLHNRGENTTLAKLVKSVQGMMRKNFGEKQLKQLKCVFPQAYFFIWQKVLGKFGKTLQETDLVILPNINYKNHILSDLGTVDLEEVKKGKLNSQMLLERGNIFNNSLIQLVKDQHRTFLTSLDPPILVDDERLTSWHKDFQLEDCKEIDTVELPPKPKVEKIMSAKEMLEKANDIFQINPQLGGSMTTAANIVKEQEQTAAAEVACAEAKIPVVAPAPVPKALRGINPKLLEKIRAKEAAKAMLEMTRDSAQIKKINQLKRLPSVAKTTRSLYVSERKASLQLEFVVKKLVQSYPGQISPTRLTEDIRALVVETGDWLRIEKVGLAEFMLIDQKQLINDIFALLDNKIKEAQAQ